jgi:hypothetical protein
MTRALSVGKGFSYQATPKPLTVREDYTPQPGPLKVDRAAGIIYGVKVLGWRSRNRREYTREMAEDAVRRKLYEGVKVRINHQVEPARFLPAEPLFGTIHNAQVSADGLFADLHYLKSHEMAERVCEDVERGLGLYGLSHDAEKNEWEFKNGVEVIHSISEVYFVDLVGKAATTANLWESQTVPTTLKELIEAAALDADRKQALLKLTEDYGVGDMGAGASADNGRGLLAQAIAALLQSPDDADHKLAEKVMQAMNAKPDNPNTGAEVVETGKAKEAAKETVKEAVTEATPPPAVTAATLTEAEVKDLCELASIEPSKELLEALTGIDRSRGQKLLKQFKAKPTPAPAKGLLDDAPRTGFGIREGQEQRGGTANGTGKDRLKFEGDDATAKRVAFLRGN